MLKKNAKIELKQSLIMSDTPPPPPPPPPHTHTHTGG